MASKSHPEESWKRKETILKIAVLYVFFTVNLEHQTSQERPKTAKIPPKLPPNDEQEAVQKRVPFLTPFWTRK